MDDHIILKANELSATYQCDLYLKPEWYGLTGSHKDKWAQAAIQLAKKAGVTKVVAMSSGNQGLALAAQAFQHNIECMIVTSKTIRPVYLDLYKKYHVTISFTEEDEAHVFEAAFQAAVADGYFPLGVTVTDRYNGAELPGIEGYEVSAQEMIDSLGYAPDIIIFPTAYADHSQGVLRGFQKLHAAGRIQSIPQFVLARAPYPQGDAAFSISTNQTTPYVTNVLEQTRGKSIFVNNAEMREAQQLCALLTGWNVELSSAAAIAALKKCDSIELTGKKVVVVLTALER